MEYFNETINDIEYKVYYTFTRQYGTSNDFHVKIEKFNFVKTTNFDYRQLLTQWQIKNRLENDLCMPVI